MKKMKTLRSDEFITSKMCFKVLNESRFSSTDVSFWLAIYHNEALRSDEDNDIEFPKTERRDARNPHFDLLPTEDCVRGGIVVVVSCINASGYTHFLQRNPLQSGQYAKFILILIERKSSQSHRPTPKWSSPQLALSCQFPLSW